MRLIKFTVLTHSGKTSSRIRYEPGYTELFDRFGFVHQIKTESNEIRFVNVTSVTDL